MHSKLKCSLGNAQHLCRLTVAKLLPLHEEERLGQSFGKAANRLLDIQVFYPTLPMRQFMGVVPLHG